MNEEQRRQLPEYFRGFWHREAISGGSPLYAALCEIVADDDFLLDLAAESQAGQPAPNMLFAAAHALVVEQPGSALAAYYASAGGSLDPDANLISAFRSFCEANRDALASLLRNNFVQTNEVRRCGALLPGFNLAWHEGGEMPLAIIEVGPSAGLNLNFDRYAYAYSSGVEAGFADSPVRLDIDVRGDFTPASVELPPVASRVGVDLNPLNVTRPADAAWLQALTWPEHHDRRELLAAAIDVAREHPPRLIQGDAADLLPSLLAGLPADVTPVVLATFVLHQLPQDAKTAFRAAIDDASHSRPITIITMGPALHLGWEGLQEDGSTFVKVGRVEAGVTRVRTLIHCHPHGRWVEWMPGDWVTVA